MCSAHIQSVVATGTYPERPEPRVEWLERLVASATGSLAPWLRPPASRFQWIVERVNEEERELGNLTERRIRRKSQILPARLRNEGYQQELVAQAFALVRIAAERT